ncbi:MAG: hydantoinase/oxoprolinase family protein [Congregibacter sp.]
MRIGIDVGGTHTDAVLLSGNDVIAFHKSSTTANVKDGVIAAMDAVLEQAGVEPARIEAVMIGTTQFTNAVIERRDLAPTAVIRIALPSGAMIPPLTDWPEDLAQAIGSLVFMVHGGQTYDGFPIAPLDTDEVDRALDAIRAAGVKQLAISAVFSPSDPSQELWLAERCAEKLPDVGITLSHRIGGIGLLERENAAILNASLCPLADRVVGAFGDALAERNMQCPFYISQNDGTLMSAEFAASFPALTFASGPTISLRGASLLTGMQDAVVVDIGGTTSDIGVLQNGFPRQSNVAIKVGGVRTNFRMPDIQAIGLGGGSLVADDGASIGPQSVGFRLLTEGRVFGGETLTATDIAVAAGSADVGDKQRVAGLPAATLENALACIHQTINDGIEQMKSSREPVPVVLVGGGAVLVSRELNGAPEVLRPAYASVANAIGAANAQVGAEAELIVSYKRQSRESAIADMQASLRDELLAAGADEPSIRIADMSETPISYTADESTRLRIKLVGDLTFSAGEL